MKYILIYLIPILLIITNCTGVNTKNDSNLTDTITTKNGYKIILKNGYLETIGSTLVNDTTVINFDGKRVVVSFSDKIGKRVFYFENNFLYKLKYGIFTDDDRYVNNQIIDIDTLSPNFIIKNTSMDLFLENLQDTVTAGTNLSVKLYVADSIFSNFKLKVVDPSKKLTYMYKNVVREKEFKNSTGAIDVIKFPSKKGYYSYQGVVENYFVREDGAKPMHVYFFKKRIFVK